MSSGPAPWPAAMAGQSWPTAAKDAVMTALGASRVWATLAHGIVTEVFWPAVDQPQIRDLGFLLAGNGWWRELKRLDTYDLSLAEPTIPLPTVVHHGDGYEVSLQFVVDPARDALVITYAVTGDGLRLYPLLAPHLSIYGPADEKDWPTYGADNRAWVDPNDSALFASGRNRHLCLLAKPGFVRGSAGFVGSTDGWSDFRIHNSMTWTYSEAGPGVVALMGELDHPNGSLALAFGDTPEHARTTGEAALQTGYAALAKTFADGWRAWADGLTLPGIADGLSPEMAAAIQQSAVVLKTHEDHAVPGAFVAALATPWGEDTNDTGGYHMVWCRDGAESGLALAAAGHSDDGAALLAYLMSKQQPDGYWPRCFFVDGASLVGLQLDETAFPVVLAGRLAQDGVALPAGADQMIRRAAGYLARNGPITGVDRWEENQGGSAFTIGLEIVALLVAANYLADPDRQFALRLADNWNERLEEFTYVAGGEVDQFFGTAGHYVRIGPPPEQIKTTIDLGNQPANVAPIAAEALIGLEFLYLPRLGLREPDDQRILDTLEVVDRLIRKDTPSGRAAYNRYNVDGYGEWLDGSGWPRRKVGIGRPWPILSGEFGHYSLLRGDDAMDEMAAMLEMRGKGGLLPEQIWDVNPLPWRSLQPGKPAGSAMPLAWAHSELIKLAITATRGQPVEQLQMVIDRWSRRPPRSDPWFWLDVAHVTRVPAERTLVVTDRQPFTLHYGFDDPDNWHDVSEREANPLGLGMFGAALEPADQAGHTSVFFVRHYPNGTWEASTGHRVTLGVPQPPVLRPPLRERSRVIARGGD